MVFNRLFFIMGINEDRVREDIIRDIDAALTRCEQLLDFRWKVVGFVVLLISGFWVLLLGKIIDSINDICYIT
jgi:hypothetical protein